MEYRRVCNTLIHNPADYPNVIPPASSYLEQPSHFPQRRPRARDNTGVEGPADAAAAAAFVAAFESSFSAAFFALLAGGDGLFAAASPSVVDSFAGGARPPLESISAAVASAISSFSSRSFTASFFLEALRFTQAGRSVYKK